MATSVRLSRRWAVPALALVGVVGIGTAPTLFPASASTPTLPTISAADLLAKAATSKVEALSGTVKLTSRLGIPSLSSLGSIGPSGNLLTSLLAGSHSAQIWVNGPDHARIALPAALAETNWIRSGSDVWSWDSATQTATHLTLPAKAEAKAAARSVEKVQSPIAMAQELLSSVTPSTNVSVRTPRYVAGRAVYQLVLSPKAAGSTIREVTVAVDAVTGVPLDLSVYGLASKPAFELGFSKVSFTAPSASTFAFTPPKGSIVKQATSASQLLSAGPSDRGERHSSSGTPDVSSPTTAGKPTILGAAWNSVAVISGMSGNLNGALGGLIQGAPTVTIGSHTGRLIHTTLVNAIVLDDGRIAVGAVTPSVLEATLRTAKV